MSWHILWICNSRVTSLNARTLYEIFRRTKSSRVLLKFGKSAKINHPSKKTNFLKVFRIFNLSDTRLKSFMFQIFVDGIFRQSLTWYFLTFSCYNTIPPHHKWKETISLTTESNYSTCLTSRVFLGLITS